MRQPLRLASAAAQHHMFSAAVFLHTEFLRKYQKTSATASAAAAAALGSDICVSNSNYTVPDTPGCPRGTCARYGDVTSTVGMRVRSRVVALVIRPLTAPAQEASVES